MSRYPQIIQMNAVKERAKEHNIQGHGGRGQHQIDDLGFNLLPTSIYLGAVCLNGVVDVDQDEEDGH